MQEKVAWHLRHVLAQSMQGHLRKLYLSASNKLHIPRLQGLACLLGAQADTVSSKYAVASYAAEWPGVQLAHCICHHLNCMC